MLDRVRLPAPKARARQYPHELSGGMLQRVMIAMALALRPEILIADEPTTALDVTVQAQILDLIREVQIEDGIGVLFITHDMGVVAEMADRVAVMHRARIVETGGAESVFRRPATAYTRALLSAVPRLGALQGQRGTRCLRRNRHRNGRSAFRPQHEFAAGYGREARPALVRGRAGDAIQFPSRLPWANA